MTRRRRDRVRRARNLLRRYGFVRGRTQREETLRIASHWPAWHVLKVARIVRQYYALVTP